MSLADLGKPPKPTFTRPCSFKAWVESLPPDDQSAVRAALYRTIGDPLYWTTPALHNRFRANGWIGSDSVVYAHRNPLGCRSCHSTT